MMATDTTFEDFRNAMAATGLPPPEAVVADGKLHRFGSNGKRGDLAGWYVLHGDGIPAGSFGDWRQGFSQNWCGMADGDMSTAEREAYRQRVQQMQAQRDAERDRVQAEACSKAATLWAQASTPKNTHPYILRKGISPNYTIRQQGDRLLIPLRDGAGKLHSLQVIQPDGGKRFLTGGRVQGCYYAIGGTPQGRVIVCEGFATGASLFEATGDAVAVAFNAGNLQAVAQVMRGKFPGLQIVIAADDDAHTPGNPGVSKAAAAAQAVQGLVAVPVFADRQEGQTDFNDLHQAQGLGAVKGCVDAATGHAVPAPQEPPQGVKLLSAADIEPEAIDWLWHGWLARGKFHLLAGSPGVGKTTLAMGLAATVSSGGQWPDGSRCDAGNVLVWSGEDDVADTLLPRLMASGADRRRCHFVAGTHQKGEVVPFSLARDMPLLQQSVRRIGGIRLLIVDPVAGAVTGDSHKGNEVRNGLQPLVDFAASSGCVVLGITHFGKGGQGADPASRVLGSVAFTAVARVVLVAAKAKDAEGKPTRILARAKGNVTPDDGGYQYHLQQVNLDGGIETTAVLWGDKVEGTARELLTDPDAPDDADETASAVELLREELTAACWTNYLAAEGAVTRHGFSKKQVWRASQKLGVLRKKVGFGKDGVTYWRLPGGSDPTLPNDSTDPKNANDSTFKKRESLESLESLEGQTDTDFVEEEL